MSEAVDRVMLNAVAADETAVAYEPAIGSHPQQGFHHHISWGTGVASGVVEVECADDSSYAGTWAPMVTFTYTSGSPKQEYAYTPGRPRAIRHRISTIVAGGTVTTRLVGAV